jgi:predicted ATPase/DNA-binding winged helix-turn-helix (wHTH) protein
VTTAAAFAFDRFEVRPASRQLRVDGAPVPIGARAFDVLLALIERRERLVGKGELLELVWPDVVVEENNLQVQISSLRKVLGPQVIATVPGRGYRFVAALDAAGTASEDAVRAVAANADTMSPVAAPLTNFPAELPRLYGREADLDAVVALIGAHRLVTVVGAGGIGKSRLAQAAAHAVAERYADGAWMVELVGVSDGALMAGTVAQALGVAMPGRGSAQDELLTALAQRTLLLVLDNCEHLLDATAALVEALMRGAPGVTVLVTSQEPLRLADEQQYRVAPLAIPSAASVAEARAFGALALLEARVRAADPRFALDDDSVALAIDVCRRLDGLPLAIELAAARIATIGLRSVRDRLEARFNLLTGGARAALRRHQTLRAALEWSYNLLTDGERAVFRRLGVFVGGFSMDMAQAVAGDEALDEWAVLDHLCALVDKSLVVTEGGAVPRYRLLESARAYALEQLAADEMAATLCRHAMAMRAFLERVDGANLDGELRTHQYAALVLPELDNLRAAYLWAAGTLDAREIAIALAAHAGSLIDYAHESVDWLLAQQPAVEAGPVAPALAARYWRALSAGNMVGHLPRAQQLEAAQRAHALYVSLDQPRRVFSCLIQIARQRIAQNDTAGAQAAADDARRYLRPEWPIESRILLLRIDGYIAQYTGRYDEALALHRESVRVTAASGDWRLEVIARSNLADTLWVAGALDDAARTILALVEALKTRFATNLDKVSVYANTIGILSEIGRLDEAVAIAPEALATMRLTCEYYLEEWVYLFWRRGQIELATRLLGASDALHARNGEPTQPNEARLMRNAREGLVGAQTDEAFLRLAAAGAAFGTAEIRSAIAEGLR